MTGAGSDRTRPGRDPSATGTAAAGLARLVAELLAPAPVAAALLLAVAWHATAGRAEAAVWAGVAVVFAALVPLAFVVRGVRRGALTDRHVRVRAQRRGPLLVAIGSVSAGLVLLALLGAPRELVALVAAMLVGLVASTAVTLFWKISFHAAVVAGTVVVLALVFGAALLVLAPLVGLVGWARIVAGDHSPAQVAAGAALGGATAAAVFPLLR